MVVAVEYISKEESEDAENAKHGVTGILAVQGAFAEHAAVLDKLGAPWKLLRATEDFDESIDRVILPGGESTTQGKLLHSTGLFEPIAVRTWCRSALRPRSKPKSMATWWACVKAISWPPPSTRNSRTIPASTSSSCRCSRFVCR